MPCYHPNHAWQPKPGAPVHMGHRSPHSQDGSRNLALPCGGCLGCRQDKANEWARRAEHEAAQWPSSSFITLTYDDEHLPEEGHLVARHLQLFLKRLRKHADSHRSRIDRDRSRGIRYFACGEYGELYGRPHYHVLAFNCGFNDRHQITGDYCESSTLYDLWDKGFHTVGEATPGGAAGYVAKYALKRISERSRGGWEWDRDGVARPAPFLRMSLKPAIGAQWLDRYRNDCTHGYLVTDGKRHAIPRAYLKRIKKNWPELAERIELHKYLHRRDNPSDREQPDRREASEHIHNQLKERTKKRKL